MTKAKKTKSVVDVVAGWICLASASLNAWNMVGVGVTWWRLLIAGSLALIGLLLLIRCFRAAPRES